MKQANNNSSNPINIGIAISEEELNINIQALMISKSVIEIINKFIDNDRINMLIHSIDSLEADYRSIYENFKDKEAERKVVPPENCEVCD